MPRQNARWKMRLGRYNGGTDGIKSSLLMDLISLPLVEWHQKTTSDKVRDNQNITGPMVCLCLESSVNTCSILHFLFNNNGRMFCFNLGENKQRERCSATHINSSPKSVRWCSVASLVLFGCLTH